MPDRVSGQTVLSILGDLTRDDRLQLSVHTGSGLVASWPTTSAHMLNDDSIATLFLGDGTLRLDPSAIYWAEIVVRETEARRAPLSTSKG